MRVVSSPLFHKEGSEGNLLSRGRGDSTYYQKEEESRESTKPNSLECSVVRYAIHNKGSQDSLVCIVFIMRKKALSNQGGSLLN